MPLYNYEWADGYNNSGGAVNVETFMPYAPRSTRIPLGNNTRTTMGGKRITDGSLLILWTWDALSQAELDDLITTIWGDWDTQNKQVTIRTRKRDDTYAYYNAVAHLPRSVDDYTNLLGEIRQNVTVELFIIGTAS